MWLPDGRVRKIRRASELLGTARELTFSCYRRLPLLSKDRTREWLLAALVAARRKHPFQLLGYVIMPEHVHLLIHLEDSEYPVDRILQTVKQSAACKALNYLRRTNPAWLDRLRRRKGEGAHFWQQGGGYDRNSTSVERTWGMLEYIHLNPVRRGLTKHSVDWPWSSAGWYAGQCEVKLQMDATPEL